MAQLIIPTKQKATRQPKSEPRMMVNVHIQAEIISDEAARHKANVWLLMNAGNLLRADHPELLLDEELTWRFDVLLTYPDQGVVGKVGKLRVDATAGTVLDSTDIVEQFTANTDALTAS